uniref:Uncharacterized protein n=1 Tax=Chrysemys picta bellii TaxID=8478 RepID=A0A8C3F9M9_CHRPI
MDFLSYLVFYSTFRETDIKKKPGHRLSKAKQRKKRKRNRKMKHDNIKITEKKSDGVPCHLIPDDQETSDSEEEDSEEENRKSVFTFNGDPGDEGCEDRSNGDCNESPKSTKHQTGSLPIAVSETSATLASPMKSDLFTEDDGTFLINLTSAPNKNLIEFEHTFDDQVVDHNQNKNLMVNESNSSDTDDHSSVLDTEYNSKENSSMMLNNQDELTSDQITSKRYEKNPWAFFSIDLTDIQFQLGSDRSGSCSWPERTHKFICEQRPKRVRRPKETYPDSTVEQTQCGSVTHGGLQSSLIDKVHHNSFIESGVTVTNCLTEVNVPSNVGTPVPSKKKGRCKRIFNLAPNFHLPRQIAVSTKEGLKDVLLMDDNLSENVLKTEQERISNKDNGKKSEQNLEFQEHLAPSNNDVTDSSLNHGVGSLLHSSQLGQSLCLSKKAVSSPAQKFPSSYCIGEREQFSVELTNSQPDILCSVKVTSDCPTYPHVFESCGEDMYKTDESKPSQSSQIEANQDTLNSKSNFLGLPLSLGFAFQLVDLFGSPGFPLVSLLPDDYIVPLDWKTSKMIHLLWKTSVERKQKKNGLQNGNSLAGKHNKMIVNVIYSVQQSVNVLPGVLSTQSSW